MEPKHKHLEIPSSEITPENLYLNRRQFIKLAGVAGASAFLAACGVALNNNTSPTPAGPSLPPGWGNSVPTPGPSVPLDAQGQSTDELGAPLNTADQIEHYNNYYEFSTAKDAVAPLSKSFQASPWSVEVGGLVHNPRTYSLQDLQKFGLQERIYRLRCVEAWSMVIPWNGFELNALLKEVEPMSSAKYVAFTTLMDKARMPGEGDPSYPWPYTEGLRLDEAMHWLTILATGLYGHELPNQDGAPIRLVVPWKYGFKSIKAIVKIDLTDQQPQTFWNTISPREYGFFSNVNPNVDHPRWSQATERRIGDLGRIPTLMFNGYFDEVASLYTGMDLKANY
jgi:sulfoxide reductase catalytic subunit YedY